MKDFFEQNGLALSAADAGEASEYLVHTLGADSVEFVFSRYARDLLCALEARLSAAQALEGFQQTLVDLVIFPGEKWTLVENWLQGVCSEEAWVELAGYVPEAVSQALAVRPIISRKRV